MRYRNRRTALVAVAVVVILAAALAALRISARSHTDSVALKQLQFESQGIDNPGAESNEYLTAAQQFAEARTSPSGIVNPGAYGTAVSDLKTMPTLPGASSWPAVDAPKAGAAASVKKVISIGLSIGTPDTGELRDKEDTGGSALRDRHIAAITAWSRLHRDGDI